MNVNKTVKRLYDMEIDEVSMVDRPANQHSMIAIAKADVEGDMPGIYDSDGHEVAVEDLEHGDVVYDSDGEELVFDAADEFDGDTVMEFDGEPELVGKAALPKWATGAWDKARRGWEGGRQATASELKSYKGRGFDPYGAVGRGAAHVSRNRKKYGYGAAGAGLGTLGAGGYYTMQKSMGDALMEELSKADGEEERDQILSKAMDEVEIAKAAAAEAWEVAESEREARFDEEFISKAAEYNLPVDPFVLGPILKSMAKTLEPEELEVIDQLFDAIGEDLYDELGYEGGGDNASVLDAVEDYAAEYVGKADVTGAQALTDVFASNPEAYEEYLSENGR